MPLKDGYGVLIGTMHSCLCDQSHQKGSYYHCNLKVRVGRSLFRCPIDLDSKQTADGVQWRVIKPEQRAYKKFLRYPDGWHELSSTPHSGALDYYRSKALKPTQACVDAVEYITVENGSDRFDHAESPWKNGTGVVAFGDLEPYLKKAVRVFVFGEPFRNGKGVHNIHQNQGDPPESRWAQENGIWQDGGVMVLEKNLVVTAFLCKFRTQRFF
ncbi:YukJ family protein [Chlorobium phaeobacteroides]|uniref:DUF2278 domain-containing protein n=1 Tax=Chlorobium phaeobacteroides (strain DSM 266 / SMG 266 / 2430) TaxID=290317 RepID=A1BIC5_CHLPD|nr:YukJ family protein [Chlorobium phaeobacteroides]ABL66152.1 conserved hypothetical protein [Chlorobium phaeobacteroides DSM 266]